MQNLCECWENQQIIRFSDNLKYVSLGISESWSPERSKIDKTEKIPSLRGWENQEEEMVRSERSNTLNICKNSLLYSHM